MYDIPYMWNLKRNDTKMNFLTKQTHRLRERTYGCGEGENGGDGLVREFGMDIYIIHYHKLDGLEQYSLLSCNYLGQKSDMSLTQLKSSDCRVVFPSGHSREKSIFLPFSSLEVIHIP